jgi:S1-C subfamily serine protease
MPGSLIEFSKEMADAVERAGAFIVGVPEGGREGVSGTVVRDGYAVTAEHTIRGRDDVTVILPSGEESRATVAGRDPGTDIALLKLSANPSSPKSGEAGHPARLATSARAGEIVLLAGRRGTEGVQATWGMVSAVGGAWRTWRGARVDQSLRLDLEPFVGFSGGPIVNAAGEVLGMAISGPRRSVLPIPAATVQRVVEQLIARGHVPQAWIGVALQPVAFPAGSWKALGIENDRGLLVVTVASGSPAEQAGIVLGDVLVTIDGAAVNSLRSLQAGLDGEKIGKSVAVQLVRGGKLVQVDVIVGERP